MGLFKVNKIEVINASNAAIASIEKRRKELYEDAIQKEMNAWFFKAKTRQNAEKRLNHYGWQGKSWLYSGYATFGKAQALKNACDMCLEDCVYLDEEELCFVATWLKR